MFCNFDIQFKLVYTCKTIKSLIIFELTLTYRVRLSCMTNPENNVQVYDGVEYFYAKLLESIGNFRKIKNI